MKTIGLIGGMSWESSLEYYRIVNQTVKSLLGGLHSADCLMYSVDFADVEILQRAGDWKQTAILLADAAQRLERGGAELLVLCTNTMHIVADEIQASVGIPMLHIADAAAQKVNSLGMHKVGLLGTKFTMEMGFYKDRLKDKHALEVLTPREDDREIVHRVIYEELVLGKILPGSKAHFVRIIEDLASQGAEGIILGCTEIGLLVKDGECGVPLFDTTRIHAEATVDLALEL